MQMYVAGIAYDRARVMKKASVEVLDDQLRLLGRALMLEDWPAARWAPTFRALYDFLAPNAGRSILL
jgi:hypothetical protein